DGGGGGRGELLPVRADRGPGGGQPGMVRPALALRTRAGDEGRPRPPRVGCARPRRRRALRAPARDAPGPGRPLPPPGRPRVLPRSGPEAVRHLRRSRGVGAQGRAQRGRLREVLERSNHRPVRGGDLGRQALPRDVTGRFRLPAWAWPLLALPVVAIVGVWAYRTISAGIQARLEATLRTMVGADVSALRQWLTAEANLAEMMAADPRVRSEVAELLALARRTGGDAESLKAAP